MKPKNGFSVHGANFFRNITFANKRETCIRVIFIEIPFDPCSINLFETYKINKKKIFKKVSLSFSLVILPWF